MGGTRTCQANRKHVTRVTGLPRPFRLIAYKAVAVIFAWLNFASDNPWLRLLTAITAILASGMVFRELALSEGYRTGRADAELAAYQTTKAYPEAKQ